MPFDIAKRLIRGEDVKIEEMKGKEYILLKILGFGDVEKASKINRYMWSIDNEIVSGLIALELSELKRFPRWIKKQKKKGDLIDELIERYFKNFDLERKEIENNYGLIRHIVENNLKEFLKEVGATEQEYKKLGVGLRKEKPKTGLERWF